MPANPAPGAVWWSAFPSAHIESGATYPRVYFRCGRIELQRGSRGGMANRLGDDPLFYRPCRSCLRSWKSAQAKTAS